MLNDLHLIFKVKLFKYLFWQVLTANCKHYYCHQIRSQVFTTEWYHCKCSTSWLWPTFSSSRNWKCEYLENSESYSRMRNCDFYRGWNLPLNETIAIGVLCDLVLHFQGQAFSCYAFAIKKLHRQQRYPAALPHLARHPPWSCSCYVSAMYILSIAVAHFYHYVFLSFSFINYIAGKLQLWNNSPVYRTKLLQLNDRTWVFLILRVVLHF